MGSLCAKNAIEKFSHLGTFKSVWSYILVVFLRRWHKNLHNPPANGKQGRYLIEMSQTPLTNKKQETWTKYMLLTLLKFPLRVNSLVNMLGF